MKCRNCGFENNDNNKFCAKCGSQMDKGKVKKKSKKKFIVLLILFFLILASATSGFFLWNRFERGKKYIEEVRNLMEQEEIVNAYQMIKNAPNECPKDELSDLKNTLEEKGKEQCLVFCKQYGNGDVAYGLCDLLGQEVLPCKYTEIEPLIDVDRDAEIWTDNKLEFYSDVKGYLLYSDKKVEVCDPLGNKILDKEYDQIDYLNDTLIVHNYLEVENHKDQDEDGEVSSNWESVENENVEIYNINGEKLVDKVYKSASFLNDNLIHIYCLAEEAETTDIYPGELDGRLIQGIINTDGKTIITPRYCFIDLCVDHNDTVMGYIVGMGEFGSGFCDQNGKLLFKIDGTPHYNKDTNQLIVRCGSVIDCYALDGTLLFDDCDLISSIGSNRYITLKYNNHSIYDIQGRLVCDFKPEDLKEVEWPGFDGYGMSGLIPVSNGTKWGYANVNSEMVIPYQYDKASKIINGFAIVEKGGKSGVINQNNEIIIPFEYDDIAYHALYQDEQIGRIHEFECYYDNGDMITKVYVEKTKHFFETNSLYTWQVFNSDSGNEVLFLESHGGRLVDDESNTISEFFEDKIACENDKSIYWETDDEFGVSNFKGENLKVVSCTFTDLHNCRVQKNLIAACDGEKSGFIDLDGNWVMDVEN